MDIKALLAGIAFPKRNGATSLRQMTDDDLAAAVAQIGERITAAESTLADLQPAIDEAAAEAFAGGTAVAATNQAEVARVRASLDTARSQSAGLQAEQVRRRIENQAAAIAGRADACRRNLAAYALAADELDETLDGSPAKSFIECYTGLHDAREVAYWSLPRTVRNDFSPDVLMRSNADEAIRIRLCALTDAMLIPRRNLLNQHELSLMPRLGVRIRAAAERLASVDFGADDE